MRAVAAIALLLAFAAVTDAQEADEPMPAAAPGAAQPTSGEPRPAAGAAQAGPAASEPPSAGAAGPEQSSPAVVPPMPWIWPDEDDPKLARGAPSRRPWWRVTHAVPRFQLAYRRLWTARLSGGKLAFDAAELEYFPVSNLIRFGVEGEFGWAGGTYGQWYALFGATLGVQYPARVTPFLEARVVAGLSGGSYLGQGVFSWMYQGGLEGGAEIYYASRFYLSLALGWTHPVYGAVDVAALMTKPPHIVHKTFSDDSFTFKIGLGL
jgi:hypothetical protein